MTQTAQILQHLKTEPITSLSALKLYGCFRLAARIDDIKNMGYKIRTELISKNGKRFARYRMVK